MVAYDSAGVAFAYGARRDGEIWLDVPAVATFHLSAAGACLTAIPAESVTPEALLDAFYGTALPLVVQAARGLEVLHGSAVLVPSRGRIVAFCGASGSGKSTVGYGLSARGCGQWADDAVAFRVDNARSLTAVGLPFTVKLRGDSSAYSHSSADALEVVEDFAWNRAPLAAVFLLEPLDRTDSGDRTIAVEPLRAGEALRALLANAFRFHPETRMRRHETLRAYLELVASVPILAVRFPRELDRLPELLDQLERCACRVA